jgi:hypothetical protein
MPPAPRDLGSADTISLKADGKTLDIDPVECEAPVFRGEGERLEYFWGVEERANRR